MRVPVAVLKAIAEQVEKISTMSMTVPQFQFAGYVVQLEYRDADARGERELYVLSIEQAGTAADAASRR